MGRLINNLKELKSMNGEGFVFSLDGGATPICRKTMYHDFHRALRQIGISDDEIAERHLHLHGPAAFLQHRITKGRVVYPAGASHNRAQVMAGAYKFI